jgi:hypothetical protein
MKHAHEVEEKRIHFDEINDFGEVANPLSYERG